MAWSSSYILLLFIFIITFSSLNQIANATQQKEKIVFEGQEYELKLVIKTPKNKEYEALLVRNTKSTANYGDAIIIKDLKTGKLVFKSGSTYDSWITKKSIKIVDLDADGRYETIFVIADEEGEENDNSLYVIYKQKNIYKQSYLENGYIFEVLDINKDGRPEILHKYNEPYFSQPGGDIGQSWSDLPLLYREDIYLFKDGKFVEVKDYTKYTAYLLNKYREYEQALEKAHSLKKKGIEWPEMPDSATYFELAEKYMKLTCERLGRKCPKTIQ